MRFTTHICELRRSSRALTATFLLCITTFAANSTADENDAITLLTIGNSFADNATRFLEQIGESTGRPIRVSKANLGGSSLERHARHLDLYRKNNDAPSGRPYKGWKSSGKDRLSLVEALESEDWDFVSLQQLSRLSFKEDTFEPYLGQLVEAIREHAPNAQIVIHQTWAYRSDSELFQNGALTQAAMHEGLTDAYDKAAARYGLKVVPVGDAFRIARAMRLWYFEESDPDFNYKNPEPGALPRQDGSLTVGWRWRTNRETGANEFGLDANHANLAGCYLGSCVFYEALTGANARMLDWRPAELSDRQAESLRQAARKAVAARVLDEGFVSIFNGENLDGWDGDPSYWRVEDGVLVGEVTEETILQRNSFIIWRGGEPDDFELKVEYRVSGEGNSGLSYRNVQLEDAPWSLSGYQADIDGRYHEKRIPRQRYTGQMWEERGRRFLALLGEIVQIDETGEAVVIGSLGDWEELEPVFKEEDWNEYHVIARGNVMTHIVNGQVTSIVIDDDKKNRRMKGLIGVQVHTGPPQTIEYRNFRLKRL